MINTRNPRKVRAASALAGLLLGAVSVMGQDVVDPKIAELAVEQAEAAVRVASLRRDVRQRELEAAQAERRAGTEPDLTVAIAEVELKTAERQLSGAQLDLEEVKAAGRPIRRELTAPLVGERDFVRERWLMELAVIESAVPAHEERVRFTNVRVRAGAASPQELTRATLDRERVLAAADRIRAMLALRSQFLAGTVSAEEVELTEQILLETERERVLRAELAIAQSGNPAAH